MLLTFLTDLCPPMQTVHFFAKFVHLRSIRSGDRNGAPFLRSVCSEGRNGAPFLCSVRSEGQNRGTEEWGSDPEVGTDERRNRAPFRRSEQMNGGTGDPF